ncbi:unnamed protein product [Acanthoscelides obtectus]|uniref:Senescence domain-containing protein n=1 Tax=Acanthoscelides obtectus TaxID=200917 RepID=A0A9P0PUL0_ACAOB|nr:unnamed protein product [Acanthoscelides obtectus]CAK1620811.1 hypothetical protein AOBTE_LOCUS582 [Acanthoscelides obtectus]
MELGTYLKTSSQKAGEFFNSTKPKLISKLPPAQQPAPVPRPLSKTMKVAECATSTAAKVTGVVAEKVGIALHPIYH